MLASLQTDVSLEANPELIKVYKMNTIPRKLAMKKHNVRIAAWSSFFNNATQRHTPNITMMIAKSMKLKIVLLVNNGLGQLAGPRPI